MNAFVGAGLPPAFQPARRAEARRRPGRADPTNAFSMERNRQGQARLLRVLFDLFHQPLHVDAVQSRLAVAVALKIYALGIG